MFIRIGHALPETSDDAQKKQTHDRPRLHGAFTGGRAAGYNNTVGSKAGFTPTAFISNRQARATYAATPNDYMDEEDRKEITVAAAPEYSIGDQARNKLDLSAGKQKVNAKMASEATRAFFKSSQSSVFDDFTASAEPIGMRLLKRLGWKGEGASISRSCGSLEAVTAVAASNAHHYGIGFSPYIKNPELATSSLRRPKSKLSLPVTSTGFGIGIFEVQDDIDVYANEQADNEFTNVIMEDLQEVQKESKKTDKKHAYVHGFVAAKRGLAALKVYPCPEAPHDFKPKFLIEVPKSALTVASTGASIEARRQMLGKQSIGKNKHSAGAWKGPATGGSVETAAATAPRPVPRVSEEIALSALEGFMPFGTDLAKQARYKQYLRVMAGKEKELDAPPYVLYTYPGNDS